MSGSVKNCKNVKLLVFVGCSQKINMYLPRSKCTYLLLLGPHILCIYFFVCCRFHGIYTASSISVNCKMTKFKVDFQLTRKSSLLLQGAIFPLDRLDVGGRTGNWPKFLNFFNPFIALRCIFLLQDVNSVQFMMMSEFCAMRRLKLCP
uniref:Uncharacterized protein n=1 Tax=Cacopsylla melanoneura TaxID=428564 RepID=A0A8D8LQZ5_9HEMI